MTEVTKDGELPRAWFEGATAQTPGPELSEATLEYACLCIFMAQQGLGFAHFRAECLRLDAKYALPHQRKEIAPLFEGDTLIGQMAVFRPFDARGHLPFIERIHPDDQAKLDALLPAEGVVPGHDMRIQRFNLHKGRYVLAGTET